MISPEELGAPFHHAAVAAAMDYDVDVICAVTAGKLMRKGVAAGLRCGEPDLVRAARRRHHPCRLHAGCRQARRRGPGVHPKRVGKPFEAQRSFAIIEGAKWVGAARAAFNGAVVASNAELERSPRLLHEDAFGKGWMLIVRADDPGWRDGLLTGPAIGPAFAAWLAAERTGTAPDSQA